MSDTTAESNPTTTVKPIPPGSVPGEGSSRGPGAVATPERGADGKFVKAAEGGAGDEAELRRRRNDPDDPLYDSTAEGEDPDHDYPIATLPGMVSEEKGAAQPRVSQPLKGAARLLDAARKAKGKGAAAATDSLVEIGSEAEAAATPVKPAETVAAKSADTPVTPAAPVDPNAPPDPNAAAKYRVKIRDEQGNPGFKEFESEEKFHENWRALHGMHRAEARKRVTAEQIAADNFRSAEDWMRLAKGYESGTIPIPGRAAETRREGDETRTATGTDTPANGATAPDEVVNGIDWTEYRRIKREARAKHGDEDGEAVAQAYLTRETAKILDARHKREREVETAPQRERDEIIAHGGKIHGLTEELRDFAYPDGSPVYPEFADAEALQEIGAVTFQRAKDGIPWDKLTTKKGLHETVLLWRDWRRMTNRPWNGSGAAAATPGVTPNGGGAVVSAVERDGVSDALSAIEARNAGVVVGGSAPVRRAPGGNPADEFRRRLLKADEVSPLGYSR